MSLATLVTEFTLAFLWLLPIPVGQGSPGPTKSTQSQLRAVGLHLGSPEGPHRWQGSSSLPRRALGNAVPSGGKALTRALEPIVHAWSRVPSVPLCVQDLTPLLPGPMIPPALLCLSGPLWNTLG